MKNGRSKGVLYAILAAGFYALNAPLSKLLLDRIAPTMTAAFLYLGAGISMTAFRLLKKRRGSGEREQRLTRGELPYTVGMVALDIAAPIALMIGLSRTSADNVALLNNFEIVATSLIAGLVFREKISPRLWLGIALVTFSSMLLSAQDMSEFSFSAGSVFVLLACLCWGFENNCTRMLSSKDPVQIVAIKGVFSGLGSFVIALCAGEPVPDVFSIFLALALGVVAYGLSIVFYIYAQRELGAAKTSAYYALAPFIGAALSLIIFREIPTGSFAVALLLMIAGTYAVTSAEGN